MSSNNLNIVPGGYSIDEIAQKMGISRERVRAIESAALKKLKHPKNQKQFEAIQETVALLNESNNNCEDTLGKLSVCREEQMSFNDSFKTFNKKYAA